jgi:DUF4097 and DUF4098 domain-containing protein YvlB
MSKLPASFVAAAVAVCLAASLPAFASAEGSFQRDLKVTGPVDLEVSTGSGNISVRTGAPDVVKVTGRIRAGDWWGSNAQEKVRKLEANPPVEQNGNVIRIGRIQDSELRRNVSISYEVIVPADTHLHANTGSGDLGVDGIRGPAEVRTGSGSMKIAGLSDTLRAETGSGDVELERIKGSVRARTGSGSIRALDISGGFDGETGSGEIRLEQSAPGSVRVETGSGSVDIKGVRGSLEARTGSGDVRAEGDANGAWQVHTGSGSVELKLPSEASFDLDAHTSSGRINMSRPVTVQGSLTRHELRGRVGKGGPPVEVHTGSGDIEIR